MNWFNAFKSPIKVGLIKGRHEMPVDEYILQSIPQGKLKDTIPQLEADIRAWLDKNDGEIHLYVTGFSPALVGFLKANKERDNVILYHRDSSIQDYEPQRW